VVLHGPHDDEGDRRHVSASLAVPARQLRTGGDAGPPLFGEPDPDDAVCLHRRVGAPTTWVYVGDGAEQALELTVDSWRRLVPALDRVLDLARA
jgi:hypothetical protein